MCISEFGLFFKCIFRNFFSLCLFSKFASGIYLFQKRISGICLSLVYISGNFLGVYFRNRFFLQVYFLEIVYYYCLFLEFVCLFPEFVSSKSVFPVFFFHKSVGSECVLFFHLFRNFLYFVFPVFVSLKLIFRKKWHELGIYLIIDHY